MTSPLQQLIETIAKEKGIEPTVIISAIEDAVLAASRKAYKSTENLKARFNPESGQVDLFAVKQIVDTVNDPALEVSLREAERENIFGEYNQRLGEVVNATVKRFETGDRKSVV